MVLVSIGMNQNTSVYLINREESWRKEKDEEQVTWMSHFIFDGQGRPLGGGDIVNRDLSDEKEPAM